MSTDLYWQPILPENGKMLPRELKYVISKRLWGHDGSLSGGSVMMSSEDIEYLKGILDASEDENVQYAVTTLIQAINDHETIEIWLK